MSSIMYLRLLRFAHQMHLFWLVVIYFISRPSGCADELLNICIDSARFLIDSLRKDIDFLISQKRQ